MYRVVLPCICIVPGRDEEPLGFPSDLHHDLALPQWRGSSLVQIRTPSGRRYGDLELSIRVHVVEQKVWSGHSPVLPMRMDLSRRCSGTQSVGDDARANLLHIYALVGSKNVQGKRHSKCAAPRPLWTRNYLTSPIVYFCAPFYYPELSLQSPRDFFSQFPASCIKLTRVSANAVFFTQGCGRLYNGYDDSLSISKRPLCIPHYWL